MSWATRRPVASEEHGAITPGFSDATVRQHDWGVAPAPDTVSEEEFLATLATFATGVALVTAHDDEYGDIGSTVTSFCSVSLDPPLVLASIGTLSRMFDILDVQPLWAVSILAADQRSAAGRFAVPGRLGGEMLLTGVPHHRGERSSALLVDGALATFECRTEQQVEAGDHTLFIGEVLGVEQVTAGEPLLRFTGRYR